MAGHAGARSVPPTVASRLRRTPCLPTVDQTASAVTLHPPRWWLWTARWWEWDPAGSGLRWPGMHSRPTAFLAVLVAVSVPLWLLPIGAWSSFFVGCRVCILNSAGNVLLDRWVRPNEKVTDFRTKVSGVRPSNLRDAPVFDEVQRQVSDLLKGRIIVGHALENDLEALLLNHRRADVRDTAKYPPLMQVQASIGYG